MERNFFEDVNDLKDQQNQKPQLIDAKKLCKFYLMIAVFIAFLLILSLCIAYYVSNQDGLLTRTILRTELDNRNFKAIILSNDLKVLLISDPESDYAGVGLNVNVGSFNDPVDMPGISHLLEHMMLKGSKKYPNSLEFASYLEENKGEKNEITGSENTIFYFIIENNKLQNALEIFSRYFLEPIFNKDSFLGEIEQIDQEYQHIISKNEYKPQFILKLMASDKHPFSRFNIGNQLYLKRIPDKQGINTYLEMIDFHQSHYSSNLMNLVLIGKQSIEVLEEWAKNKFSLIKNNLVERLNLKKLPRPYGYNQLGFIAKIHSNIKENKLYLVFPLTELQSKFKEKPLDYIDFLIKYAGKQGLRSKLKRLNMIFSIKTLIYEETSDFTLYGIEISLTNTGFLNISTILENIYGYFKEIEKYGVNPSIFQDLSKISKISFRFLEQKPMNIELREMTKNLGLFPIHNVISGSLIYLNYDPDLIHQILQGFSVRNCIVIVESANFNYNNQTNNNFSKNINNSMNFLEKEEKLDETDKTIKKLKNNEILTNKSLLLDINETLNKTIIDVSIDSDILQRNFLNYSLIDPSLFNENITKIEKLSKNTQIFKNSSKKNTLFFQKPRFKENSNDFISFLKMRETADESYFIKPELSGYSELYELGFAFEKMDQTLFNRFLNPNIKGFSLPHPNQYIPEKFIMIPMCQLSDLSPVPLLDYNNITSNDNTNKTDNSNVTDNSSNQNSSKNSSKTLNFSKTTTNNTFLSKIEKNLDSREISQKNRSSLLLDCSFNDISNDQAQDYPDLLYTDNKFLIWHKLDRSFKAPKVEILISWENTLVWLSAKEYQMISILIRVYAEILEEEIPEIHMNGYILDLSASYKGIIIKLTGFSDKIDKIMEYFFKILKNMPIQEDLFVNILEEIKRDYALELEDHSPIKKSKTLLQKILRKRFYTVEKLEETLNLINFQEIESFNARFLEKGRLKSLFIGNLLNSTALQIMQNGINILNISEITGQDEAYSEKILNISRKSLLFQIKSTNIKSPFLMNYYQYGIKDITNLTKLFLIINGLDAYSQNLMKIDPNYDENVEISLFYESGIYGISIFLNKYNKTCVEMDHLIENFIGIYYEILKKYSNDDFEKLKGIITAVIKETDKSLGEKAERYWNEIFSGFLDFDQKNRMKRIMEILSLNEILEFYRYFFKEISGKIGLYYMSDSKKNEKKNGGVLQSNETFVGLETEIYEENADLEKIGRFESQPQNK